MEEQFETFDEAGNPTGLVPRSRVHRQGYWHCAVHVLLFTGDDRLWLQRRQLTKDIWPGAWDLSAAEHLKPGETFEQAAIRGLDEELDVRGVDLVALGGIKPFRLDMPEAAVKDYEFQRTFAARYEGPVSPDPIEVLEARLIDRDTLEAELTEDDGAFTPWFRSELTDLNILSRWAALC